ncbi:hypothetical protein C9422_02240 [Pseudomonas sp. B1(2018)]|nr:hypothetical protein C9422_02240 [Pseudomonas sp. B1(2018)]
MDVNDNAPCLNDRVVRPFFASRLAPTGRARVYSGPVATEAPCRSCRRLRSFDPAFKRSQPRCTRQLLQGRRLLTGCGQQRMQHARDQQRGVFVSQVAGVFQQHRPG